MRPSVDKESPDAFVHVHLFHDRCTVSVDSAGAALHKRGWRCVQGRAPLAETLAAAMVLMSGWDGRAPLIDPFCGSGTILIEAALIGMRVPPGMFREEFGFERFPGHDADAWRRMCDKASDEIQPPRKLTLLGGDRDAKAIEGARENLAAAGLADHVDVRVIGPEGFHGRLDLGTADIVVLMKNLPLKVGQVDGVEVHDADRSHARQGQVDRDG